VRSHLFTVGYEGRQLDELLAILQDAAVDTVIDIRQLPLSRRRGFSKTPLAEALRGAGIEYVHVRAAGNPFRHDDDALAKYAKYVTKADDVVDEVAETARGRRASPLCYEGDVPTCPRGPPPLPGRGGWNCTCRLFTLTGGVRRGVRRLPGRISSATAPRVDRGLYEPKAKLPRLYRMTPSR